MTEKQEKILQAALQLFAKDGFKATSTSKVAKAAEVSEGLIFRHFGNKEGLLQAILDDGAEKFKALIVDVVMETEPAEVIRKAIEMPIRIDKTNYNFWKLQFKLKWEMEISSEKKMEPLRMALSNAFQKLGYLEPTHESELIILFIDGIGSALIKGSSINMNEIIKTLLLKYKLY